MKVLRLLLLASLVITLGGCPDMTNIDPDYLTVVPTIPGNELLFQLPEDVNVVSESFHFSLLKDEMRYTDDNWMLVTATYVFQNDGDDVDVDFMLPIFPVENMELDYWLDEGLNFKVNNTNITPNWMFTKKFEDLRSYQTYTYDTVFERLAKKDEYLIDEVIHTYEFTLPLAGEDEELTIFIPKGTKILQDYYSEKESDIASRLTDLFIYLGGDMVIEPTEKVTTGRFYTIGNEATFTSNYDMRNSFYARSFEKFSEQRCYAEWCEKIKHNALYEFSISKINQDSYYDILGQSHSTSDVLYAFNTTATLPGNKNQTAIEVSFPIKGGYSYTTDEEYEENQFNYDFDFYFDSERYSNDSIPVNITVDEELEILFSNHNTIDGNTIELIDSEQNRLIFNVTKRRLND